MSPERQRIAIAEACGWTPYDMGTKCVMFFFRPGRKGWRELYHTQECPDYLNDLNAMHEAEKTLTREQRDTYSSELYTLLPCDENCGPISMDDPGAGDVMIASMFQVAHATAAQRAEALLKTLGKWEDAS